MWLSLREGRSPWLALIGALALAAYGVVAPLQPANFGRVYAAYGGVFIVLSLAWGWGVAATGRIAGTISAERSACLERH